MFRDQVGLHTRVLAVVAAVPLLIWVAALFGLGRQVGALPAEVVAPSLPSLPAAGMPAVSVPDNEEMLARPLFASDRLPHPFVIGGNEPTGTTTLRLTGVLMTPTLRMATLTTDQGRSIRLRVEGEAQGGWRLLSLEPRAATLSGPSGVLNLPLQVSRGDQAVNGRGTPVGAAQAAPRTGGRPAPPATSEPPPKAVPLQRPSRER